MAGLVTLISNLRIEAGKGRASGGGVTGKTGEGAATGAGMGMRCGVREGYQ